MRRCAYVAIAMFVSTSTWAEIEKIATPSATGLSFAWWPKLTPPAGWAHDRQQSLAYGLNALSREGSTFSNAEAVMYAKAVYKPREPGITSLAMFIAKDRKDFLASDPKLSIREVDPITAKDGKVFRVFSFLPKAEGNWERVAYSEEGEFYLVFALSARNERGYKASGPDFEKLVRGYSEKP